MKIKNLDHFVITTKNLAACLGFYENILGMEHVEKNNRHALKFGKQKINIHTSPGEFQPSAQRPTHGALDICLIVEEDIFEVKKYLESCGCKLVEGVVERNGALGVMDSVYVYDPDGNLVELAAYR